MNEKKIRSVAPASPGSAASQKSWLGVKWKPIRGSCTTTTLHIIHTANATTSAGADTRRLRRATRAPSRAQNARSSGSQ